MEINENQAAHHPSRAFPHGPRHLGSLGLLPRPRHSGDAPRLGKAHLPFGRRRNLTPSNREESVGTCLPRTSLTSVLVVSWLDVHISCVFRAPGALLVPLPHPPSRAGLPQPRTRCLPPISHTHKAAAPLRMAAAAESVASFLAHHLSVPAGPHLGEAHLACGQRHHRNCLCLLEVLAPPPVLGGLRIAVPLRSALHRALRLKGVVVDLRTGPSSPSTLREAKKMAIASNARTR